MKIPRCGIGILACATLAQTSFVETSVLAEDLIYTPQPLDCFEVAPPVILPGSSHGSSNQLLMRHTFGNSYGKPFVGQFTPPEADFNRVVLNLTASSSGRQFDRLALIFLGDIEVWRTSTAEPKATGIVWTHLKDMSHYLSLWRHPQKLIFDLGNLVNENYTGSFTVTLSATFFNDELIERTASPPADVIVPLSRRIADKDAPSHFTVPSTRALSNLSVPVNAKRAVFSIAACGQIDEEFWWGNVPESRTGTFVNNTLLGHSPFRELELLIDGRTAGFSWPFPVIFTGGVVPGFWRPVVGIDAFDLHEDEIDITPWLPLLSDGKSHTFEIKISGLSEDRNGSVVTSSIGSYWVVTGKLFLWLDQTPGAVMTGNAPFVNSPLPSFTITSSTHGGQQNSSLDYYVEAERSFTVTNTINTPQGSHMVSWEQSLEYRNVGNFTKAGVVQKNDMRIAGWARSSSGYLRQFAYPLIVNQSFEINKTSGALSLEAQLDRSRIESVIGASVFPSPLDSFKGHGPFAGVKMVNRQNGSATYFRDPSVPMFVSSGYTEQDLEVAGVVVATRVGQKVLSNGEIPLYKRHVLAINDSVVSDSDSDKSSKRFSHVGVSGHGEPEFAEPGSKHSIFDYT